MADQNDEPVKLTVQVSPETMGALETMAGEQGKLMPVLVRDATAVAYAIHKELRAGGEIIVERRRGRRVALLFEWFASGTEPPTPEASAVPRPRRSR